MNNRFSYASFLVVVTLFLVACAGPKSVSSASITPDDRRFCRDMGREDTECLETHAQTRLEVERSQRKAEEGRLAEKRRNAPLPPPSLAASAPIAQPVQPPALVPTPAPIVPSSVQLLLGGIGYLRNGDAGCMPGYNLSVRNDTAANGRLGYFLEVASEDKVLLPCGTGTLESAGLATIMVSDPNGTVRTAIVIPPGMLGKFYFSPQQIVAGRPVPTTVTQRSYRIAAYAFGGPQGTAAMPARHIVTLPQRMLEVPTGSRWWRAPVTAGDINGGLRIARGGRPW